MSPTLSFPIKVAAVVTTFKADKSIIPNLDRIAKQVELVIVVDDSGDWSRESILDCDEMTNAVVIHNEGNLGIAAALNRGVIHAELMGCDWVISLDDDTLVSTTYIDDVIAFLQTGIVASIGLIACARNEGLKASIKINDYTLKRNLITSGCVFSIKKFHEVGGFDENLFIDLVDFDFCTRLRKSGSVIVQLNKVGMDHRVGNSKEIRFLAMKVVVYNHSPFRLYYQMRNLFLFAKKHLVFDPLLSLYLMLDVIRLPLKALLFEQDKEARLFYLAVGLKDGLFCRGGKLARRFSAHF